MDEGWGYSIKNIKGEGSSSLVRVPRTQGRIGEGV